ncbi:MAG: 5-formyltetrahydrofolate cyclo-ligase [Burkholderiaceae bacterium]
MNPGAEKKAARSRLMAWRKTFTGPPRRAAEAAIGARVEPVLRALRERVPAPVVAVFCPIRGEPDLRAHYARWRDAGFALALPVTPAGPAPLQFALWPQDAVLRPDAFGVPTPVERMICLPDALLIPCLGFAQGAWRLGYGGGFYDRTLAAAEAGEAGWAGAPLAIGIAFDAAQWPALPHEPHDRPLAMIITERRTLLREPSARTAGVDGGAAEG